MIEAVKTEFPKEKIWSLDIIKLIDKTVVSRGMYRFNYGKDTYYMKWIKNKLEYKVGKELASLNRKEFLIPICMFQEKSYDKRPLIKHIYQKDYYYMISKEMQGRELDQVIPELTTDQFKILIQTIIQALEDAWNKIKFVHGDLHLRNVFVNDQLEPMIFDFEHSSIHLLHPKKTFLKDLSILLTNLALNVKNEKSEVIMQFVDQYFQEPSDSGISSRNRFQESLYACIPNF